MVDETKLVGVTIPLTTYNKIVEQLKPLESVQDFIREATEEKLLREVK
jgi:hypothetical protein